MKNEFNIKLILVLSLTIIVGACTQNFEETNTNPNSPTEVPVTNNFGGVIYSFSPFLNPGTGVGQHSNYVGVRLLVTTQAYLSIGEEWGGYYTPLTNINSILAASEKSGSKNMEAVALTFRAQMTQIATDNWRDMPYTEACKASEGNITPKYDTQEEIYSFIIADLKKAADIFKSGGTDALGAGDILNNGDVQKWQKYCNSLRLRIAIRISDVDQATSLGIINEVLDNPTDYPVLESNADNIELTWPGTSPWEEDYWYWWYCCHHDGAGKVLVDIMNPLNDPRLPIWFVPATTDGKFRGSEKVGYTADYVREDISDYNPVFVSGNPSPTGLNEYGVSDGYFRYSEICFLKAEIYYRDLKTGNAQEEYEKGIEASMKQYGVSDADLATYMTTAGVALEGTADDLIKIYTQKYLALYLMANEGWAEARRTDVPVLPLATNSAYPDHNRAPFRVPYPQTEQALNSKNCEEFLPNVEDFFWGQKMWWDTRAGVN